jgi:hypothetical protein
LPYSVLCSKKAGFSLMKTFDQGVKTAPDAFKILGRGLFALPE